MKIGFAIAGICFLICWIGWGYVLYEIEKGHKQSEKYLKFISDKQEWYRIWEEK